MQAIVIEEITKEYEGRRVLGPISFEVNEKSIHGFLGPNGAGKSTTFKIIAGLLNSTSGRAIIAGHNVNDGKDVVKKSIGILPENAPLMKEMKVEEYLFYVCRLHGLSKKDAKKAVSETIEKLSLQEVSKRLIGNLSKGYKQRVGVAQAIVCNPPIILLDEPTAGLDPASVIEIRKLILELKKDHTILFSSHLLHEVEMVCDEVTIIDHGEKIYSGKIDEVLKHTEKNIVVEINAASASADTFSQIKSVEILNIETDSKGKWFITLTSSEDGATSLMKELMQQNIEVTEFKFRKNDLEKAYLSITRGSDK